MIVKEDAELFKSFRMFLTSPGVSEMACATSAPPSARSPNKAKAGSRAAGAAADVSRYFRRSRTCRGSLENWPLMLFRKHRHLKNSIKQTDGTDQLQSPHSWHRR